MQASLSRSLIAWLLVPLLAGWGINAFLTYSTALESANAAYDRTLYGAALAISERVTVEGGRLSADLPYAALEMLESNLQSRVYYRVGSREHGLATGYDDLPQPERWPAQAQKPVYFETNYRGERIRLVNLLRPVYDPAYSGAALIQVGETLESRQALSRRLLLETAAKELALIAGAAALIWVGVWWSLRPLARIRREVLGRDRADLAPLATVRLPREVVPLVDAINVHMERLARLIDAQRQFVSDASHQLRTPLAVVKTQAELALRQADTEAMRAALRELAAGTEAMARLAHQLLVLARSEPDHAPPLETLDLTPLARASTFEWLPRALERGIDLGFEGGGEHRVRANPVLLRELLANLIDNAIRYTAPGGRATVRVLTEARRTLLEVEDDGPGVPPAEREKVLGRFYRLPGSAAEGCGLGLAIVKEICATHGATLRLDAGSGARGLCVQINFAPAQ
jgi:two-component system sensor histidine kinase TctE